MSDEFEYHHRKLSGRTYISGSFEAARLQPTPRKVRFASKVIDSREHSECVVDGDEIIVRTTAGGRQEIKALFHEDDRSIPRLNIFRYSTVSGKATKSQFSFSGDEVAIICRFLRVIDNAILADGAKLRFDDQDIDEALGDNNVLLAFLNRNKSRIAQIDTSALRNFLEFTERNQQLTVFQKLLRDRDYFREMQLTWGVSGPEAVWQTFFEQNPWIFGLGLAPIFIEKFKPERLENVIAGHSVFSRGKRVDALLRTSGVLSSICLAEIKTHNTPLLKSSAQYRPDVWSVSDEVSGGVSQCQKTAQRASEHLATRLVLQDSSGNPLSREAFNYEPRAYLIVGSLAEFVTSHGPNESKFSSFELYRRNLKSPEIITFDELFARAKATVQLQVE